MYDDFAVLDAEKITMANKEYQKQCAGNILSVKSLLPQDNENLWQKISYLQRLLDKLKQNTKNQDTLLVLEGVLQDVQNQQDKLNVLLNNSTITMGETQPETVIFCNNLKLAIQTAGEIVEVLIKLKDSEETAGELRPDITNIILSFLNINNKLVSLFGECRDRTFGQKRRF